MLTGGQHVEWTNRGVVATLWRLRHVLGLWLQVHGRQVLTESYRGGAVADGPAVDGGEGQPGPELMPGGSCGVHSWTEGASGDGRRVSWFAPQNQGGGRRHRGEDFVSKKEHRPSE